MSNFKDFIKNGWHPEKEGTTLKSQVSGLIGRQKAAPSSNDGSRHASRPLSSLVDPSSFAPPPQRTASSLTSTPASRGFVSTPVRSDGPHASRPPALPPPPGRRDGTDGTSPQPRPHDTATIKPRPTPPSLPPRLPPRNGSHGTPKTALDGHLNEGAVGRLGAAGVSVHGLGIGRSTSFDPRLPLAQHSLADRLGNPGKDSQDMSNFLGSPSVSSPSQAPPPAQGTTWAQKQAAFKKASSFYKNPSSVTLADAKATAGTVNNLRHRHGDQIQTGLARANDLNRRYDVANKLGAHVDRQSPAADLAAKKPPPPPPPKKKAGLGSPASAREADGGNDGAPLPVPMSTRPLF